MPSFLTLTSQVASTPASAPHYPLPYLYKTPATKLTSPKQQFTSSPQTLMLTLLLPAPPLIASNHEGHRFYISDILHDLRSRRTQTPHATLSIECHNIIIGQPNSKVFRSFKTGEFVTAIQILSEPVSGLDLPNYAAEWERQILGALGPIVTRNWEIHGAVSEVPVSDEQPFLFQTRPRSSYTGTIKVPGMEILSGEKDGRDVLAEIAQWEVRTEVAVIEDVPFLAVMDGVREVQGDELEKVVRGVDMRGVKGNAEMFRDASGERWDRFQSRLRFSA
ncbi:uncharacterized protein BDV14DRAFT_203641 [Aspergillus stella-maris]|uniref:uncharacterized protein n=1 Tax=Aspergillus stella-maris TaxID=1810926 RepID=UPI003CCD0253